MRKRGKKSKRPNKELFFAMYYNDYKTVEEIADYFNVSAKTIYNWAHQFYKEEKEKEMNLSDKQIYIRENYKKKERKIQ